LELSGRHRPSLLRLDSWVRAHYTGDKHGTLLPNLWANPGQREVLRTRSSGSHLQGLPAPAARRARPHHVHG
jgi:hypothetical protein